MSNSLDHGDMVHNILSYWQAATPEQHEEGAAWYGKAGRIVDAIAHEAGMPASRVAFALAALSPRNPWRWNVADCFAYATARKAGMTMPKATTFKRNQLRAWKALGQDGSPWDSEAPKVTAFVAAILGDSYAVVVDQWAYRVATLARSKAISPKAYRAVAAAYIEAAALAGTTPSTMQAVTWLVAQSEGLASLRAGRHDLTFKAGTHEFVKELLS